MTTATCGTKHAKWALLIVGVMLAVCVTVTLATVNAYMTPMSALEPRVRVLEVEAARQGEFRDTVKESLKRIEDAVKEKKGTWP